MITVAVDFDGVIHSYTSKWKSPEYIPDPPVPGAIDWLNTLVMSHVRSYIFTTRAQTPEGIKAIRDWLERNGYWYSDTILITQQKFPAHMYVDDRAYCFTGTNFPTPAEIAAFDRWKAK